MFVLNELLIDRGRALLFIERLVGAMRKGVFLLLVDSASDFSQARVGKNAKSNKRTTAAGPTADRQQDGEDDDADDLSDDKAAVDDAHGESSSHPLSSPADDKQQWFRIRAYVSRGHVF